MEFSSDGKTRAIKPLLDALFREVLYDEEPLFVSDDATILDVSVAPTEELLRRCAAYYETLVSEEDLRTPLWRSLPDLEARRAARRQT